MATQTLEAKKLNLIVRISKLGNERAVSKVEQAIAQAESDLTERQSELLRKLSKPPRKKTDIEELKREQNWKGFDRAKFDRIVKELDVKEPLEQLIADIGK